jgi:hypothetical protein
VHRTEDDIVSIADLDLHHSIITDSGGIPEGVLKYVENHPL